jgi:hypothetical protein
MRREIKPAVTQVQKSMLTPQELSARISVPLGQLQNWRVRRNTGEDIGPKFVKLTAPGSRTRGGAVRYMLIHVEEWERQLAYSEECPRGTPQAKDGAKTSPQPPNESIGPSSSGVTMLTPVEMSERSGIRLAYLSNWRVRRNAGEEIGPRFIKLGRHVRYLLSDVEEWERTHAARDNRFPASTAPRRDWD